MLDVRPQPNTSYDFSKAAPEVYIDSVEVYNNKISLYYHIEDEISTRMTSPRWINNEEILNSLNIYIYCNQQLHKESLASLKKNSRIIDFKLYGNIDFIINTSNLTIAVEAYCGNDNVVGVKSTENILTNGYISSSTYNKEKFNYINKCKDLRLLELAELKVDKPVQKDVYKKLFISYTPQKKAYLAYFFNLEQHLLNSSSTFRALSKYTNFKEIILNNSYIDFSKSSFYKKNKDISYSEYNKINSNILNYKVSDSLLSSDEIITITDDNTDTKNTNKYSVKTKLYISDYSDVFFKKYILDGFKKSKKFIEKYKNILESNIKNDYIEKNNVNFYQYNFENYLESVNTNTEFASKETIESLSHIYSFYNNKNIKYYYMLFASLLHPLTANANLLTLLLNSLDILEKQFNVLFSDVYNDTLKENYFEYNFTSSGMDGRSIDDEIDYDYDSEYGYDVISYDDKETRIAQSSFKIIPPSDKDYRKRLELVKYFGSVDQNLANKLQHFSISSLDLDKNSYYLLPITQASFEAPFKEIMSLINQYNDSKYKFVSPELYFYNLLDKNVYIKSISSRNNTSVNELKISTISDSNTDSKQKSLEYITSTGIETLYYVLDNNKIYDIPKNILQYEATLEKNTYGSNFILTKEVKENIEYKPKIIGMYNNFFEDKIIVDGENYSLYELKEAVLNSLYSKKLKQFNKYYLLEKNKNVRQAVQPTQEYVFYNELKGYNIPAKYLNRVETKQNIILTVEDI